MMRISRLPKSEDVSLLPQESPLKDYIERLLASERDYRKVPYAIDLHIFGESLIEIPPRFKRYF
jgi:hypothetical protein